VTVDLEYATPGQTVTVNYATSDGTATAPADYVSTTGTLTFLPGVTSQTFTVPINDNGLPSADKTFSVNLSSPMNAVLGTWSTSTVTIYDDELPTVTVAATQPNAAEAGPVNGQFTISRTGSLDNDVTVYYQMSGTATSGVDYSGLSGSVLLPAGVASTTLTLTPVDDMLIDGNETAVLTLLPDIYYSIGGSGTDTVTIADDPRRTYQS
jgi:hypothetical protein